MVVSHQAFEFFLVPSSLLGLGNLMWSSPARGTFCGLDNRQPTDALGVSDTQNSRKHKIAPKGTSGALGKRGVLQEREWWVGSVTVLTRGRDIWRPAEPECA